MSNNAISRPTTARVCPACESPLAEDARFCPSCGARAVDPSVLSTVDAYINKQLDQEVAKRFTDQSSIAREIGDKAEDVIWKRLRIFTVLLVILLALVGILGYKTVNDVIQIIEKGTAEKVDTVKLRLDELAQDVEAQTKRVTERGGDISNRLAQLDKTANEAQARVELYLSRADELSEQMAKRITELDTKVAQVSTQVDRVSVKQEYPSLGQAKVITYRGGQWNKGDKKPNEKWIGLYIFPYAIGDFSSAEIESLDSDLRAAGYTLLPGTFGIGGPYSTGAGDLGNGGGNAGLNYFSKSAEQMSADVRPIILKDLPIKNLETVFVDASTMTQDDPRRFVIENSGLDLQLVLRPLPK
jgi:hypothetical protein